jgi:hypothetical protein
MPAGIGWTAHDGEFLLQQAETRPQQEESDVAAASRLSYGAGPRLSVSVKPS